jgi:hypothetical protein
LPQQVFAVILSEGLSPESKDPEEVNSPQPLELFSPHLFRRCFLLSNFDVTSIFASDLLSAVTLAFGIKRRALALQKGPRRRRTEQSRGAGAKSSGTDLLPLPRFFFHRFPPKNRMSSPQTHQKSNKPNQQLPTRTHLAFFPPKTRIMEIAG